MGCRADNIDNHKLDNEHFAVEHDLSAGFAIGHEHFALDDAIIVAERNDLDHAERFLHQQLPRGHGAPDQRECHRRHEHDKLDAQQLDEHHFSQFEQQHLAQRFRKFDAELEQQHLTQQLFDDEFDFDQHQLNSRYLEHCQRGLRSGQRIGGSPVFQHRQLDWHHRYQQQRDDDSGLDLQRRDHHSEQHGDDSELAGDAEYHHSEQLDDPVDQP